MEEYKYTFGLLNLLPAPSPPHTHTHVFARKMGSKHHVRQTEGTIQPSKVEYKLEQLLTFFISLSFGYFY